MRYVEMTREGLMVSGHLTSEEIYDWKTKGYTLRKAEKIDYNFINKIWSDGLKKEKKAIYNKAGVRIG